MCPRGSWRPPSEGPLGLRHGRIREPDGHRVVHGALKDTWDGERDPLAALRAGRSGPFEAFVQAEIRTFLGFFFRLGANRSEAEDLTQDTFLKLYASSAQVSGSSAQVQAVDATKGDPPKAGAETETEIEIEAAASPVRYDARGQFAGYAFRVARNVWIDRVRKSAGDRSVSESDSGTGLGGVDVHADPRIEQPEARAMRIESSERIREAVASLPESHREVFELAVVEELPYAAISEALDIPIGTVKSRMHNAVRRVRTALEEEDRVRDAVRARDAGRGGHA